MASGNYTMRGRFRQTRRDPAADPMRASRQPQSPPESTRAEKTVSFRPSAQPGPAQASADAGIASVGSLRVPALPEYDIRCGALTRTLLQATPDSGGIADGSKTHRGPVSVRISNATTGAQDDAPDSLSANRSDVSLDVGQLSEDDAARIVALTDTSDMKTIDDALARIDEIATLYANADDARGIFPVTYRVITQRALQGVEEGSFEHEDWARALIVQFAEHFLVNLRAHMTGEEVSPAWQTYFDRADDADVSVAGVLGSGIFAHLVDDLPMTLAEIHSKPEQAEDFTKFGILLLEVYPELIKTMDQHYEADVSPLLTGFAAGKLVDHVWGDGSTTELLFQSIRQKAWIMGQRLQKDCTSDIARFEMAQSLSVLQLALRGLT